jgi:hypothetical protein
MSGDFNDFFFAPRQRALCRAYSDEASADMAHSGSANWRAVARLPMLAQSTAIELRAGSVERGMVGLIAARKES